MASKPLKGQVALVTGAAQGLGKEFVNILLEKGAQVTLTDVKEDDGKKTVEEFRKKFPPTDVLFIKADVTSEYDMKNAFSQTKSKFGRVDIVINNAGIGDYLWEKCVDINLKGVIWGTRLALDYMSKDKGGHGGVIINISSAGGLEPQPEGPVYSATKAAVIMYSRSIAAMLEKTQGGVRVNTLCPAFVDTPMVTALEKSSESARQQVERAGKMTVREVAEVMYDLLTDRRSGRVIAVSKRGGQNIVDKGHDPTTPPSTAS